MTTREIRKNTLLELPSIGWLLFILDSAQSDSTAFPSCLDTYATRLLTEPLSTLAGQTLPTDKYDASYRSAARILSTGELRRTLQPVHDFAPRPANRYHQRYGRVALAR